MMIIQLLEGYITLMRPAIFSSVFISILLAVSANANATSWYKVVEPPSGKTISQGIPCGAGTGWQMCGYPKEPENDCVLDTSLNNTTMVVWHYVGMNANSLQSHQVWWKGKKIYSGYDVKYTNGRKKIGGYYYKSNGKIGNIYYDAPQLRGKVGMDRGIPKFKDRYSFTNLQNNLFWEVCRSQ